ncbi:MAG: response regulator transcription factor, partial [Candidatus Thorarchaeota archaeon]
EVSVTTTILIVDDEPGIVDILAEYLRRYIDDLEVIAALNGEAALEKISNLKTEGRLPQMTLMDLKMPVMDGISCTKKLTEQGVENVHILTAYVDRELISKAVSAGAKGLLMKSEGLRTIAMKVSEMIRGMRTPV